MPDVLADGAGCALDLYAPPPGASPGNGHRRTIDDISKHWRKSFTGNSAIYSERTVRALVESPAVKRLHAFFKYGYLAIEEHFWAIALDPVWKSTSVSGAPDNSSPSHFSAMTRPSWLGRAARNRHRHAIEQASRRWRGGRRDDSARTRRKILISTQVVVPTGSIGHFDLYLFLGVIAQFIVYLAIASVAADFVSNWLLGDRSIDLKYKPVSYTHLTLPTKA